jgi:hypothetical protein
MELAHPVVMFEGYDSIVTKNPTKGNKDVSNFTELFAEKLKENS